MAIWHYEIILLPEEEVNSYSPNLTHFDADLMEKVEWWKYRQLTLSDFKYFERILSIEKSWSKDITQFGKEDSNNISLFNTNEVIKEINVRIDVRDYLKFADKIIGFCIKHKLLYIDGDRLINYPDIGRLKEQIKEFKSNFPIGI